MIQRDLKIGLVVGLVIVAGIIVLLATDPRLSTESRINNLDDSIGGLDSIDSNNVYVQDDIISQLPFRNTYSSNQNQDEQSEPLQQQEPVNKEIEEVAEQNNNEQIYYPALQQTQEQTPPPTSPSIRTQMELPGVPQTPSTPEVVKKTERIHVVQDGQTLSKISSIYYNSPNQWKKIVDANPDVIKDPDKIKPGMRLVIP